MRICVLPTVLIFGALLLGGCESDGPRWVYVCDEPASGETEKQCRAELGDEEHILTIKRTDGAWKMVVLRPGERYVRGELTAESAQGGAVKLTATHKDYTCMAEQCMFSMPEEAVDALRKAKQFSVTLKTATISRHSVRHTDHTREFVTKGLTKVLRKLST